MYWLLHQKGNPSVQYFDTVFSYCIFVGSCFVAFVVHMVVFFLQVELDPVVKTHDLLAILGFSHKHVFKPTGILTIMYGYNILQRQFIKRPCVPSFILSSSPLITLLPLIWCICISAQIMAEHTQRLTQPLTLL